MGFPSRDIVLYVMTVGHEVASRQGRSCARQRRFVRHDRPRARTTETRVRQKSYITIDIYSDKKKDPWNLGRHIFIFYLNP